MPTLLPYANLWVAKQGQTPLQSLLGLKVLRLEFTHNLQLSRWMMQAAVLEVRISNQQSLPAGPIRWQGEFPMRLMRLCMPSFAAPRYTHDLQGSLRSAEWAKLQCNRWQLRVSPASSETMLVSWARPLSLTKREVLLRSPHACSI